MTDAPAPSLQEIASCIAGYDPKALPVAQAQEFIARLVPRVQAVEMLALRSALGRVLARDVISPIDVPAHDNSAMDGYAVRGSELGAGADAVFTVAGAGFAGGRVEERVGVGECVRIMTGAVMPGRARHRRAAGVRPRRRRPGRGARRRRAPRRQPAPAPAKTWRAARSRSAPAASAPGRHRHARLARPGRGAGVPAPARRLLLDRRRAALDRRSADPGRGLRQQPLHALGDAAAARRRGDRPRRRARRSGGARGGVSQRRARRRRGDHVGRRQRRRGRPHQARHGEPRRRAVLAHRDAARPADGDRPDRAPGTARSCSACRAIRSR